jgi:predicted O-methyltransferase YrrM
MEILVKRYDEIISVLWNGVDPYNGFNPSRFRRDDQGWNSHHEFLSSTLTLIKPAVVIEIGVWKGGSSIHMAKSAIEAGLDTIIISIDTWLGSWEHWEQKENIPALLFQNGYPMLYYTFLTNVMETGVSKRVIPLPLDSANAAFVIQRKGILPQVIHIDGAHDFDAVLADLNRWWPILEPGGFIIMDDYDPSGRVWPSVRDAVDAFIRTNQHMSFEQKPYKCRFQKPLIVNQAGESGI